MQAYHKQHFLNDVSRMPVTRVPANHMRESLRGLGFFDSLDGVKIAEARRLPFAVCFYFETLIDQGLHHHFPHAHERFQAVRPLPKFGTFGMGPHIRPPAAFLEAARARWKLPREPLASLLGEGARHFPAWALEFFARNLVPASASELFRALGDQDLGDLGVVRWVEEGTHAAASKPRKKTARKTPRKKRPAR